ncbi:TPA: molybdenum cofactor cytidylyltransferase [Candidatus Latescibacteria bacterium]|mgnify:CR=1 FL=1|nr:molybdenum cofactor cytidylyltransferase [Candidatus Latescibacterota bacterium]|tara:strand:+ start:1927 stop:2547 length:621 start_codon:yes stop_codon:yes gene_type:complete
MSQTIAAVVLAAGLSRRMGRPKQLLPFGEDTVLQTVVKMLQSVPVERVVVVLGYKAVAVRESLPEGVEYVVNANYTEGMFTSVLAGLGAIEKDADGMLMLLGDQPQITAEVTRAVKDRFHRTEKGIVIPEVEGRRGHPVAIDINRYGDRIRGLDGAEGLKPVVRGYPDDTDVVCWDDASILRDMDTPEDYEREIRLRENESRGSHG